MLTPRSRTAQNMPDFGSPHRSHPPRRRRASGPPLGLVIPAALVGLVMLIPVLYLVMRTAQADSRVWDLIVRPRTFDVLRNTSLLAGAVGLTTTVIAVPLAWLTVRCDLPGRRFWATVAALPLVIPSYVGALTIIAFLGPKGSLQQVLAGPFGIDRLPEIYGFTGAWLALSLFTYPYVYLAVRAALRGLDPSMEEAARCLGHGPCRTFFLTTLPRLRPAIAAGGLLTALYTISDFGVVTLLRYDAFTRAIYVQYRSSFDRSMAAALALVLVLLAVIVLVIEAKVRGRVTHDRIGAGAGRRVRLVPLGKWTVPAIIYCVVVAIASLGMPLGVLVTWLVRDLQRNGDMPNIATAGWHSLSVGLVTAAVATVAGLPIAILAVRQRGWIGKWAERASFLGYALPGIVIALTFVFIGANYLTPIYQTVPLLVLAYVVRFLPQAIAAMRTSLGQINPRLEEAARGLGMSQRLALLKVVVPIARPGIAAGAALVLLTVMKELPVTLLLSPTGYATLATKVWTLTDSGEFGKAAVPALVLVGLSSIPTLILITRGASSGAPRLDEG